jgi:hypothetical protein
MPRQHSSLGSSLRCELARDELRHDPCMDKKDQRDSFTALPVDCGWSREESVEGAVLLVRNRRYL